MENLNDYKLNSLAAEYLSNTNSEKFQELKELCKPMIADIRLIPQVVDIVARTYDKKPENMPTILGVVYYLFCRYTLHFNYTRARNGIRSQLCNVMEWKDAPTVNYYSSIMKAYYRGPRFAKNIQELANAVYDELIDKGEIKSKNIEAYGE